jgi:acetyltransferase-like isoleucine patch superfamily enzyme
MTNFDVLNEDGARTLRDVKVGSRVRIYSYVNAYECEIGEDTTIGTLTEIQKGVRIGKKCKVSSHSFLCEGVIIEDEVFIGHGVMFTNDRLPRSTDRFGNILGSMDWLCLKTTVKRRASIGSGSVILPGVVIGEESVIGAGSVVTHDVPRRALAYGNPARVIRQLSESEI